MVSVDKPAYVPNPAHRPNYPGGRANNPNKDPEPRDANEVYGRMQLAILTIPTDGGEEVTTPGIGIPILR